MSSLIGFSLIGLIILFLAWGTLFIVEQQTSAVVERFGKFVRVGQSGLNMKIPVIESVSGRISLRVQQLDVAVETKTLDNVFVKIVVSVQFFVLRSKVFEAFYRLENPEQQIRSFIFDVVRSRIPKIKLDDVFERKDDVAVAIKDELTDVMSGFGYGFVKALVTDIDPDAKVKAAMNEINEAQRLRVAATERGEAEKILKVKQAEAEARSNALQGKGIADQRKAIIDGLKESIDEFQRAVAGTDAKEVMNLVLLTQYFDTLKGIGSNSHSNTILIPHSPGGLSDLSAQMRNAIITANQVTNGSNAKRSPTTDDHS
ncbi:MAG: SPFH domain-containing protein [Gammaproteobacteria bacterium]|nr:SPFH domain-containing protein [Gammaproteobacteria bacterium]